MGDQNTKNESRDAILDAALELFARKGYEAAGVQAIVDAAGMTKPALYYYFNNKEGLLEVLIGEYGAALITVLTRAARYHHKLIMNLKELLGVTLGFAEWCPDFWRLMINCFAAAPETTSYAEGKELRNKIITVLKDLFSSASKDHGNMIDRETLYAETFFALLERCALLSLNGELKLDDHTQFRIIHQFMHGIFS
jgi:TetR/AcrR family transcriptional regulator